MTEDTDHQPSAPTDTGGQPADLSLQVEAEPTTKPTRKAAPRRKVSVRKEKDVAGVVAAVMEEPTVAKADAPGVAADDLPAPKARRASRKKT